MPSRSYAFCAAVSRFITARGSPTARAYAALMGAATACSSLGAVFARRQCCGPACHRGRGTTAMRETASSPPNGYTAVVLEGATRAVPRVAGDCRSAARVSARRGPADRSGCGGGSVSRMALPPGTHRLGPGNASLQVRTYREGVAAKAGHDLIIDVTRWEATVEVAEESGGSPIELTADPRSLEVREGLRGVKPLTDKDRLEIRRNIEAKVLSGHPIRFRSNSVLLVDDGGRLTVEGELSMAGRARPLIAHL